MKIVSVEEFLRDLAGVYGVAPQVFKGWKGGCVDIFMNCHFDRLNKCCGVAVGYFFCVLNSHYGCNPFGEPGAFSFFLPLRLDRFYTDLEQSLL